MIYEQTLPSETALVEWQPIQDVDKPLYSVYRTERAIELRIGCANRAEARLICTQACYYDAYDLCEILADEFDLPIKTYA